MRPMKRNIRIDADPSDLLEACVTTFTVNVDDDVFRAARQAQFSLERENFRPARFLLGNLSYLSLYAAVVDDGYRAFRYPVLWEQDGEEPQLFGLPVSLDPSKPDNWVQCLPITNIHTATWEKLPANFGVGRGLAADTPKDIRRIVEAMELPERRKIVLPDEAYGELAKACVVTSYWDDKYPRKPAADWNGENFIRR